MLELNFYPWREERIQYLKNRNIKYLFLSVLLCFVLLIYFLKIYPRQTIKNKTVVVEENPKSKLVKPVIEKVYKLTNDERVDYQLLKTIPRVQRHIAGFIINNNQKDILIRLPSGKTVLSPI